MSRHAEPVRASHEPRVLIVEDDLKLGRTLVRGLREAGFTVEIAPNGEAGLSALDQRPADVVMLDVVLPGIDGFETCRRLRGRDARTPVVMLSARGGVADVLPGRDVGADDSLAKPFSFLELVARLRALVRRGERRRADPVEVGRLRVAPAARKAWREHVELDLTAREFDLLEALARRAGDVVSRDWLLEQGGGIGHRPRPHVAAADAP